MLRSMPKSSMWSPPSSSMLYEYILPPTRATFPVNLILLHFINIITLISKSFWWRYINIAIVFLGTR
jgi:hypothetical protein